MNKRLVALVWGLVLLMVVVLFPSLILYVLSIFGIVLLGICAGYVVRVVQKDDPIQVQNWQFDAESKIDAILQYVLNPEHSNTIVGLRFWADRAKIRTRIVAVLANTSSPHDIYDDALELCIVRLKSVLKQRPTFAGDSSSHRYEEPRFNMPPDDEVSSVEEMAEEVIRRAKTHNGFENMADKAVKKAFETYSKDVVSGSGILWEDVFDKAWELFTTQGKQNVPEILVTFKPEGA